MFEKAEINDTVYTLALGTQPTVVSQRRTQDLV